MKIITITNQKGGVAKTTTAAALGFGLAARGFKVLFVDADAQGNLTETVFPVDEKGMLIHDFGKKSLFNVMLQECKLKDTIRQSQYENVEVVPADISLSEIDMRLVTTLRREFIIKNALEEVKDDYDYCIIDTPPSLGWMTLNSLVASDYVIIPTYTERFSLNGINQLNENITVVRTSVNPKLKILGLVITRSKKNSLARDMKEILAQTAANMQTNVFEQSIREQVAINEAQMNNVNIYDYMKNARRTRTGNVADDYNKFTDEVLKRMEE